MEQQLLVVKDDLAGSNAKCRETKEKLEETVDEDCQLGAKTTSMKTIFENALKGIQYFKGQMGNSFQKQSKEIKDQLT
jgi:hypothetical protein